MDERIAVKLQSLLRDKLQGSIAIANEFAPLA